MFDIVYANLSDDLSGYRTLLERYPHAILLDKYTSLANAMKQIRNLCYTDMVWLVSDSWQTPTGDILSWRPWNQDKLVPYYWTFDNSAVPQHKSITQGTVSSLQAGSYLLPLKYTALESDTDIAMITGDNPGTLPFDIFFVSYSEPNADENWQRLVTRFPYAKRVHGIKGIDNAHRHCASLSVSGMFWTVDADTIIHDTFAFDSIPDMAERGYLYIWHSLNPVNGLDYGWGSIKLWPTRAVLEFDGNWLDFTTTIGNIRMMPTVVATSTFNTDEWSAWRSGFREAVKLCVNVSNGDHADSLQRLLVWLTVANPVEYAVDTRNGAIDGLNFFMTATDLRDLLVINDFDKLQLLFNGRKTYAESHCTAEQLLNLLKDRALA